MTYLENITRYIARQAPISEFVKLYIEEFKNKPNLVVIDDYFEQVVRVLKSGEVVRYQEEEDDYDEDSYSYDEYEEDSYE